MKIIKFPENRIKNKLAQQIRNYDKTVIANFIISLSTLLVGVAIIWFIIHKLNS